MEEGGAAMEEGGAAGEKGVDDEGSGSVLRGRTNQST
jgi:hypothetical protein